MSDYVLLNKVSTNVLCLMLLTTFLLTPFAFLISLPSAAIKEYIFYFNPTNALIIFPLNSVFTSPINFLLTKSKNVESCE